MASRCLTGTTVQPKISDFFQISKAQKASHVSKSLRFSAGGLTLIVWKQNVVHEKKVSDA